MTNKSSADIRLAKKRDLKKIMLFIKNEWSHDHILANNQLFFEYQYCSDNNVNFVIALEGKRIMGVLGFIKSSDNEDSDIWLALWKVIKSKSSPFFLGIQMLNFLLERKFNNVLCLGINESTIPIYKFLNFYLGSLNQFYIPNKKVKEYKIAQYNFNDQIIKRVPKRDMRYKLKEVTSSFLKKNFQFDKYKKRVPFKDWAYIDNRYFRHPIYRYNVYGIFFKEDIIALIVTRRVYSNASSALRIIDFYGEESSLPFIIESLQDKMHESKDEYLDIMCFGIPENILFKSGFNKLKRKSSETIIPNYFEPFEQKNITIDFFVSSQEMGNVRIYKGDGDQDRPNKSYE